MPKRNEPLRVLLAVDDSPYSQAAIDHLTRLSPPECCELRVVHVVEPLDRAFYPELTPPFPSTLAEIQRERVRKGEQILARALDRVKAAGYDASGRLGRGHVRSAILEAAEKWRADLILMGSRGRTGLKRALLGSVSDHVMRHAHCSVLIVRPKSA